DILHTAVRISQRLLSLNFCFLGEFSEGQLSRCTGHPTRKSSPSGLGREATYIGCRTQRRLCIHHRPFMYSIDRCRLHRRR
ncbi:MAG: hypothetical protein ACMG6H_15375, partial [Acidobacteriota bacterium]